jgi:MYXO-CTERM domain-containing protein
MKKVAALALLAMAGSALAGNTVVITYDGGFGASVNNVYNAVAVADPFATHLYNPAPGAVAAYMGSNTVDNLFIFDITASNMMGASDAAAVGAWYNSSKSAVIDGRSYGVYFNGNSTSSDEGTYIQNTANWFQNNGGGLWIGTDHNPDWTNNGNQYLAAAGFMQIIDIETGAATGFNASPLYAGVNVAGLDWSGQGWSVGHTPVGLQPNGVMLSNILYAGPGDPMISTSLVPAPGAAGALALVGIAALRRRR